MLHGGEQVIYPPTTSDSLAPPILPTYMLPNKLWVINNHYSKPVLISRGETCIMINKILVCIFSSDLHKAGHWPEYIGLYSFLPALGWLGLDMNTASAGHTSPPNPRQTLRRQNSRLQNPYTNTTCSQAAKEWFRAVFNHTYTSTKSICVWTDLQNDYVYLWWNIKDWGGAFLAKSENYLKENNENEAKFHSH